MGVEIRPMIAADVLAIERQPSQRVQLGFRETPSEADAQGLIDDGEAWAAVDGDRVIACFGIRETFPGKQGVAWAILSSAVGAAHLAITRFAKRRIAESPLVRIEAIARVAISAECVWPRLTGLQAAHVLRKFGAASEDHMLFERVR